MLKTEIKLDACIEEVEGKISRIENWMEKAPEGHIEFSKKRNRYYWYHVYENNEGERKRVYIKRDNRQLAEKLALKKYFLKALPYYQKLLLFLSGETVKKPDNTDILKFTLPDSPYRGLLSKSLAYTSVPEEIEAWLAESFEKSTGFPEDLTNTAASGALVRSKSEVIIMDALDAHCIPYRYECKLLVGDKEIYPDFTIKHPKTGKIFYWEHFGKMDDDEYKERAREKMLRYYNNGFFPSINMIVTCEDSKHPLSSKEVHGIIETYFL